MAERRLHGLQRVLGVNALFSTAYGNVGSSIYYALGLVASFALGLTPLVFVITGFIFYLDGRHLRRGDGDVPGGRRLVELRPPRVQRVLVASSPPGRRCSTTRSRSPSRRSSCRTTSAALFWEPLRHVARGHHLRHRRRRSSCCARQRRRRQGVGRRQHPLARRRLRSRSCCSCSSALLLVFSPEHAGRQRPPRRRADVEGLLPRDPGRDDRLHRHRDDLEHGRGGQGRDEDDPGGDQPRRHRRLRDLRAAAGGRAVARCR